MKCIIIDDEQHAIDVLKAHIGKIPNLELIGTFTNPLLGLKEIKNKKVELVFLDIQMDEISGIDVMNIINDEVKIVLCTAFSEYALEGFNNNAVDYLLKPVSFERFLKSIDKVQKLFVKECDINEIKEEQFIYLKTEQKGKFIKIFYHDIDYIESLGNYVAFHKENKKITVYATMKDLEKTLPINQFIRIHKSYIVNLAKIHIIENGFVFLKGFSQTFKLSIGNNFKDNFMNTMKKNLL